ADAMSRVTAEACDAAPDLRGARGFGGDGHALDARITGEMINGWIVAEGFELTAGHLEDSAAPEGFFQHGAVSRRQRAHLVVGARNNDGRKLAARRRDSRLEIFRQPGVVWTRFGRCRE